MNAISNNDKLAELRKRAEEALANSSAPNVEAAALDDVRKLLSELQIHQIELEMQNEELRATQLQLRQEREKYADLYNFAPMAYFVLDDRDVMLDLNLRAAELLGSERKYLLDRPITPYLTPESLQIFVEHRQRALVMETPQTCELTVRLRDGSQVYVQAHTVALRADPNEAQLWRSVMTDITERKRAETQLRQQAEWMQFISDAVITTDINLLIINWNEAAARIYGWSAAEADGQEVDKLLKTEFIGITQAEAQASLAKNGIWRGSVRQRTKNGAEIYIEAAVTFLKDVSGNIIGGITVNRDITARKRVENTMQVRVHITEFAAEHSLDDLLQNALDELCALTDSPIGFFHFVAPDQKTLSLQAWSTRTLAEMCAAEGKGHSYNIDQAGVWVDCVREGRPVIHNDYNNLPHRKGLPEGHAPIVREMVFPIMRSQKIVAIIGVGNKRLDYTQDDLAYASRLADLIWDITARKQAEAELNAAREQVERFFNLVPDLVCIASADGYFKKVNEAWETTLGFTAAELLSDPFENFIHPDDIEPTRREVARQIGGSSTIDFVNRYRTQTGSYKWLEWHATPSLDGLTLYAAARDITDRKRAEQELRDKEVQYRMLADSGLALIWASGMDKLCKYFNEPWLKFTGRTLEQEMGNGWAEGVHPDDFDRCLQTYLTAFDKRQPFDMEYRLRHVSGEYRWIRDLGTPNYNSAAEFIGYIGHCFDISEQKKAEDEIQRLYTQAQEDARIKAELLEEVNHRVRNNLTRIQSIIQLKRRQPATTTAEQAALLDIQTRIDGMLTVHSMLSSSTWRPLALGDLIRQIIHGALAASPIQENVVVEMSFQPETCSRQTIIPGQATTLALILNEMTMNSVKYAFDGRQKGRIKAEVSLEEDNMLRLDFRDDGPGLPEDALAGKREGIGLRLIRGAMQSLPGGRIQLLNDGGAAALIKFKLALP